MPKNSEDFNNESLLRSLEEYKRRDPHFRRAIEDFVDAEAKYGADDERKVERFPKGPK